MKDYGLTIVLAGLFLFSWIGQGVFQYFEILQDIQDHGAVFEWTKFIVVVASRTFENWQSEFLQLFTFVLLSSWLIHKGSPQSKDGGEEMRRSLEELHRKVDALSGGLAER
jgi:hypothetical protein